MPEDNEITLVKRSEDGAPLMVCAETFTQAEINPFTSILDRASISPLQKGEKSRVPYGMHDKETIMRILEKALGMENRRKFIWDYMASLPKSYRGHGMTDRRVDRLKKIVWNDDDFWQDILSRHGLDNTNPDDMDSFSLNHAIGNFWSMLYQSAVEHRIIKP